MFSLVKSLSKGKGYLSRFFNSGNTFGQAKIIGIDLGTTNSCVAIPEGKDIKVIESDEGRRTTPSVVAFDPNSGNVIVGEKAKRQSVLNPLNTFYATKRLIGRKFEDPIVQDDIPLTSYEIVKHSNGDAWVCSDFDGTKYSPSQIGSFVLGKMKEIAEDYLGEPVTDAVVTVPAYFNNSQKQATKDAGRIAGLNVLRIINEPTAAALAFGMDTSKEGIVAVFDLGGGTFDISILEITNDGESNIFEVLSTNGDTHLGGEDFDQIITDHIIREFESLEGVDLSCDSVAVQRIKEQSEVIKKELDHMDECTMSLPFIVMGDDPKNLEISISKMLFEEMARDTIERTIEPCKKAMKDARITPKDISEVLLVGGQTRMPAVQELVMNIFGKKPNKQINPDECVAIGAAIQGAILSKDFDGLLLVDITPLSLGIETVGDTFARIIPRNSAIPTKKSEPFTTSVDNQTNIVVKVYQGEREIASKNKLLGDFSLSGIPPAPAGVPSIEVTFEIDENGIINVTAQDGATGKIANVTVQSSGGLTDDEIQSMVEEAERFKDEDMKVKRVIEMKNNTENIIGLLEKALRDLDGVIDSTESMQTNDLINDVRKALSEEDLDTLEVLFEKLKTEQGKFSERAYKLKSEGRGGGSEE